MEQIEETGGNEVALLARAWARGVLRDENAVIVDVETTGLEEDAEIVQIGIVDMKGRVLLDALVQPDTPIPGSATRIHGIGNEDVRKAATYHMLHWAVTWLLGGRRVVAYNAEFDERMLRQTCVRYRLVMPKAASWHCAMTHYAEFWGEWNDYHQNFRWQSLGAACAQQGIEQGGAHSAVGDCLATLEILGRMAIGDESEKTSPPSPLP